MMLDRPVLSSQGFPIFPAPFPTGEAVGGETRRAELHARRSRDERRYQQTEGFSCPVPASADK